ncbi:MAG: hypothetical protein RL687_332 [Candidatus Parcubacteria bacterium]
MTDKCTHGPLSSVEEIKKHPTWGVFLFLSFLVFNVCFAPFAVLIKLDLFSDEFLVLA